MKKDNFNDWDIEEDQVIEYELDDNTYIRYYMKLQQYIAEWVDNNDGEEYFIYLPEEFETIQINNIPFTMDEFKEFKELVEGEKNNG